MSNIQEIPPIITTSHLLLRGLIPAFVGCSIGDNDEKGGKEMVRASAFQMTYRKDLNKIGAENGGYTGKLSWNLGKKWGVETSSIKLPHEEDYTKDDYLKQCEEFWVQLELAINNFIKSTSDENREGGKGVNVKKYNYPNEETALEKLGCGIYDAGQLASRDKRIKKAVKAAKEGTVVDEDTTQVSVGQITLNDDETSIMALLHGNKLLSLKSIGKIKILRSNPKSESYITCNKKKCEIVIKFSVLPSVDGGSDDGLLVDGVQNLDINDNDAPGVVGLVSSDKCMSKEIRLEEGKAYQLDREKQLAAEAEAAALKSKEATPTTTTNTAEDTKSDEMVVTAFEVSGSIDYTKLIEKFGSRPLTPYLLRRLENVTVKRGTVPNLHRFLRREIFFSHRDIEKICELLEDWYGVNPPSEDPSVAEDEQQGEIPPPPTTPCPIYLYTGRGPSSAAMHLGHLVPFLFTAWLQKAFQCPLVVQMTDDEKFLFKGEYNGDNAGDGNSDSDEPYRTGDNLDRFANLTTENAKDIIACEFIPEKTFLFSDLDYVGTMYPNIVRIWKAVTTNQVNGVFGFDGTSNIGKIAFPAIQAAPSFGSSFPTVLNPGEGEEGGRNAATLACLIPCAIDQDPYFRLTRDVAHKLVPKHHPLKGKPALIHSKFFPPLQGAQGKMSSSDDSSAIFLTDTPEDIEKKIKENAFSGGQDTKKLQEELGANLEVDVSYQWLRFFLEDDEELARIGQEYGSGKGEYWSTGCVKAKLVSVLKELVAEHQERRSKVTEEVIKKFMTNRSCV